MNSEEIKLTKYLHNIIEDNMSLRNENDRLWKQKLEYIDRISKAIEYATKEMRIVNDNEYHILVEILKGEKE